MKRFFVLAVALLCAARSIDAGFPIPTIVRAQVTQPASGPGLPHVADSNARLSLTAEGVVVSGAGRAAVNAGYTQRGTNEGKPYYNPTSSPDSLTAYSIIWKTSHGDAQWIIGDSDGSVLYSSTEDVARPDLVTTWTDAGGGSPLPTVTHSPGQVTGAGYQVIQDDDGLTYTFNGDGADADAGLWVTGAGTAIWIDAYASTGPGTYNGINNGQSVNDTGGEWDFGNLPVAYASSDHPTYPWQATWNVGVGDSPAPTVQRNPIASEANWSHP